MSPASVSTRLAHRHRRPPALRLGPSQAPPLSGPLAPSRFPRQDPSPRGSASQGAQRLQGCPVECCLDTAPAPRGSARPRPVWAPEVLWGGGGRES
uniref:Uncharacterized protein n=1 Tax=Microcebus murinus TaxID=30608 RepID=A0A8C6ELF2_MICMU